MGGQRITIARAQAVAPTEPVRAPGTVVATLSNGVRVSAGSGDVLVTQVTVDGHVFEGAAVAKFLPLGVLGGSLLSGM
jgi:methionyl-tRNA formyltransferase